MDILKIPTDNLYKFLAVSGLVAFLGCAYLAFFESQSMDRLWSDYLIKSKSVDLRIGGLQENRASRITFVFSMIDAGKKDDARKLLQENEEKEEALKQAMFEKALQEPYFVYLKKETFRTQFIVLSLRIGSVGGLMCSIVGFLGWYFKVQKYLDKKISLEFK